MRRLAIFTLTLLALIGMKSGVSAENPNDDVGKPSFEVSMDQARRVAAVVTLDGTASDEAIAVRSQVFVALAYRHMGQIRHNPGKAIDVAVDELSAMPAADVVPASGSGGGYHPPCVNHNWTGCGSGGMSNPAWLPCFRYYLQDMIACWWNYGTCSGTWVGGGGQCELYTYPLTGARLCRFVHNITRLGLGSDGVLNVSFQVYWTAPGVASSPISIGISRECPGGFTPTTWSAPISPATTPNGTWVGPFTFPTCGKADTRPGIVRLSVDQDPNLNQTVNTSWALRQDCN